MLLNYVKSRITYSSYLVLRRYLSYGSISCIINEGRCSRVKAGWRKPLIRCSICLSSDIQKIVLPHCRREKHTSPADVQFKSTERISNETESSISFTSRTHTCGSLRTEDIGKHVRLSGWIQSVHFLGKFVQLRDWEGWTQLVFTEDKTDMLEKINSLKLESVIEITGIVREREQINKNIPTGMVEVFVDSLNVLSEVSKDVPFIQKNSIDKVNETLQMEYRYLAIRYKQLQRNLRLRSQIIMKMREFLANKHNFVDVETPTLFRRTPGGAKEFVVPTKHPGQFYSLPQSPQQFKQLLMVGGVDRYFQIAKCYRDEGSKPDRQPEFTQLDIEMSFVTREGILNLIEELLEYCWPTDMPSLNTPFPRMTYQQAMRLYGSDKPDTRFDMKIHLLSDEEGDTKTMGIKFQDTVKHISKSKLNSFLKFAKYKPQVKWQLYKCSDLDNVDSSIKDMISQAWNCRIDDVIITATGEETACCEVLGMFRLFIADELEKKGQVIREPNTFNFLWVLDFPLFLPKEEGEGLESAHHPFTDVHPEDFHLFHNHPEQVRGQHYDLVLNGSEVGGGSIRIHNPEKQRYVIEDVLKEDVRELEHLLKAFTMGCPPHGGIALGLDRLLACIMGTQSIRDVIAFPKSAEGRDPMSKAPAEISKEELDRYHISVVTEKK